MAYYIYSLYRSAPSVYLQEKCKKQQENILCDMSSIIIFFVCVAWMLQSMNGDTCRANLGLIKLFLYDLAGYENYLILRKRI